MSTTVVEAPVKELATLKLVPGETEKEQKDKIIKSVLDRIAKQTYGDWRDELLENGYVVVKNVIPREKAREYQKQAFKWMNRFSDKFDPQNPETWVRENLPPSSKINSFSTHCLPHEKFIWDVRMEPGVLKAFEDLWGTEKLVVSFDAMNVTFPNRKDKEPLAAWPHVDQSPYLRGMQCSQGIVSLSDSGPEDGGLVVYRGTHKLVDEFFDTVVPKEEWNEKNFHTMTKDQLQWFLDRGCEEVKVECEAGDLIIWDSRTIHWGKEPSETSKTIRTAVYACYTPVEFASQKCLDDKKAIFESWEGTTHWSHGEVLRRSRKAYHPDGTEFENNRDEPFEKPVLSDRLLQLAGAKSYD
ncbi:hypothetical protein OGAPHI_006353 [Ogataea philodendri]|uniref:Phytanoyl-CoA dioxygenase n=1 Tax=Ogataea philodendri TaxID=1378263 RepID=A0A9P8T1B5_9ASCO|nr:uncharacterized protein OGAPHI_006353 [Ogataea philodendri]KAH3661506.1 hypothetical protein OGAPHI_006353 [Ogataea philodendri]